jgi:glycosyltransferase involved in cell wall biosynthesis
MSLPVIVFAVLFLISAGLIFYTYVLFPSILGWLSGKQGPVKPEAGNIHLPVSIIMSVFNEETVIAEKLNTILSGNFPASKIEIIIGSDCSTDATNEIVEDFSAKYPNIRFHLYTERRGKPAVINDLIAAATHEIIILTDANVLFEKDTIAKLQVPFSHADVGLVGANILNIGLKKDGISFQEKSYIQRENMGMHDGTIWRMLCIEEKSLRKGSERIPG